MAKTLNDLSMENCHLKEKVHRIESKNLIDFNNYKNELKSIKDDNFVLKNQLDHLSNNYQKQTAELNKIKYERDHLLGDFNNKEGKMLQLTRENESLKFDIEKYRKILNEKNTEILRLNNNEGCNNKVCLINDHENYEEILKQNNVLQEVVRHMRKERKENLENLESMRGAERRIKFLEESLELLKKQYVDENENK